MPYQNDMNSLADIVGPAYAAQQAGIRNDLENQKTQMANQVYQAQMPALEQEPGLHNLFTQAQTAGQSAATQGNVLSNISKAGTLGSSINAGNAGNNLEISRAQVGQIQQLSLMAGNLAGIMDGVAPPARPAKMQEILQAAGVRPDQMEQLGPLLRGDPEMLRHIATNAVQMTPGYQTSMGVEGLRANAVLGSASINSDAKQQVALTNAQAKIEVENMAMHVKQQLATTDQQLAQFAKKISAGQASPGEIQMFKVLQANQLQLRQYQAQTTRALLGMGDLSGMTGNGPDQPTTPEPQLPPQHNPMPDAASVEAEMKRRGLLK